MPSYTEMRLLLLGKMVSTDGGKLQTDYEGGQITLDLDPYFPDYANIGAFLSSAENRPAIKKALENLEADMEGEIGGTWRFFDKKTWATSHFNKQRDSFAPKKTPVSPDSDFRALLTKALDKFERSHGFVVPAKLPIFAGFVFGNVFKDTIKNRMHFKDIGAGVNHGEFTHRIQWYAAVKAGALVTVDKEDAGTVYGAIHRWLNKSPGKGARLLQLWNYIFDMNTPLLGKGESLGKDDFRAPENFNLWLTGDAEPDFCPLLRSFLRTRMTKRQTFLIEDYFKKKLGSEAGRVAFESWQTSRDNSSARIVYSDKGAPSYSPKVI